MQEESFSDHELTLASVWGTTKIVPYEEEPEEQALLPFLPGPRWRVTKTKKKAELPPAQTKVMFAKDDQRTLKGLYMEITLGRILFNLHVIACRNEKSVVSLVELRYQNPCKFGQPIPTIIMTDSGGVPTSGRSFNEISKVVLKDKKVPVWFPSPAQFLEAEEETTGWVVFDRLARDCNDIRIGSAT